MDPCVGGKQIFPPDTPGLRLSFEEAEELTRMTEIIQHIWQMLGARTVRVQTMIPQETQLGKFGGSEKKIVHLLEPGQTIRYDLTVGIARLYLDNNLTERIIACLMGEVFRKEIRDGSHFGEFRQAEFDIFGTRSPNDDAFIIFYVVHVLETLNIRNFIIRYNSRGILRGVAELIGVPVLKLQHDLDSIDKSWNGRLGSGLDIFENSILPLSSLGYSPPQIATMFEFCAISRLYRDPIQAINTLLRHHSQHPQLLEALEECRTILSFCSPEVRRYIICDVFLARGADYYVAAIWEVIVLGCDVGAIFGGGRYSLWGVPGVGGAFGVDRLHIAAREQGIHFPEHRLPTVALFGEPGPRTMQVQKALISNGVRTICIEGSLNPLGPDRDENMFYYNMNSGFWLFSLPDNRIREIVRNVW
jgi:histidyl-tRNA synthetase